MKHELFKEALLIRRVEETFLDLFSQGKLNGTVHTCVGQEFSAVAFAGQLESDDFIFSSHRCHGHYISYTKDIEGLITELMGKEAGICGGIGSSQHLCNNGFYSNGIQGGIVPVAAGMALVTKINKTSNIGVVFIGDGTLGEGIVYETLNIISKWEIPLLVVCENNQYAQSTHCNKTLSGDIISRAKSFGIQTYETNTWDLKDIFSVSEKAINYVRSGRPAFCLVDTYRLNPHSKGDDNRDKKEIKKYLEKDPLNVFAKNNKDIYSDFKVEIDLAINKVITKSEASSEMPISKYYNDTVKRDPGNWSSVPSINIRQVELIQNFFYKAMNDKDIVFLGEDITAPYGGAFKVSKDLSIKYPERVFSTPISEAAITGISNGLALGGMRPFLEIMFGDFITLCLDQIINHSSKFHHMYNKQVNCPIVIRTPMGGRRGYGPTHSQTLDKFLLGIDNFRVLAINILDDPAVIYKSILEKEIHPVIVIENKADYNKKIGYNIPPGFINQSDGNVYPTYRIMPYKITPNLTIVAYGGMIDVALGSLLTLFKELEVFAEIIVPTSLCPLDLEPILTSVHKTGRLVTLEEGSGYSGFGGEIIAQVCEIADFNFTAKRIAAMPVPIPSAKSLEMEVLPTSNTIIETVRSLFR